MAESQTEDIRHRLAGQFTPRTEDVALLLEENRKIREALNDALVTFEGTKWAETYRALASDTGE